VILVLGEVAFYYGRYPQTHEFADPNTEAAYEISQYLNTLEGEWAAYFYGPPVMYSDFPTFTYLLTDFQRGLNFFDVEQPLPGTFTEAPNQVFIFIPARFGDMTAVRAAYPGGQLQTFDGYYSAPLFQVYTIQN